MPFKFFNITCICCKTDRFINCIHGRGPGCAVYGAHFTKHLASGVENCQLLFFFNNPYTAINQKKDVKSFPLSKDIPVSFIKGYESLKKMSSDILHDDLIAAGKFNSTPWLSSIKVPSLVLWGEHDSITPKELPIKLSDLLPVSEFIIINNSGHVIMIDARNEFNTIAKDFIEQNG